jgi:shikimate kinase
LELQQLRQLLQRRPAPGVVATGGGIVEIPDALPLLRQLGRVVWLRADPEVCIARLGAARTARPLLDGDADWRPRYARREPLYRLAAQRIVDTDRGDVETSLEALVRCLDPDGAAPRNGL